MLANPEMAGLAPWVIALVGGGGLAAALSTAAGLLLVILTAISHNLMKKVIMPRSVTSRSFCSPVWRRS